MSAQEWFEFKVMVAAEDARKAGYIQTHLALLDVLRASRYSEQRMIGSLSNNSRDVAVTPLVEQQDPQPHPGLTIQ
ncbi:hypothetical protein [uncultured Tateyamaria sp.]|uniref:hypothetical protein n=1 Tax=uncultured Tateyamaria sp. TaxID=455651 RepID=UPI0026032D8D|nr:hypothetical protein [uncultured Tateyamaria sp.]